jgi:DNA (cytosine-5)-methyltransferase 1
MDVKVMSAEQFGVPSKRRRAIIMGVRGGKPSFPNPLSKVQQSKNIVKVALDNLTTRGGKIFNHDVDRAQISNELDFKRLKKIPAGAGIRYQKDELAYLPKKLRYDVDWEKISEGRFRQTRLQRLPLENPAPTILTSRTTYYHPLEHRYLTVREAARLQSFPNNFIFEGSLTAQFRQIGNAVPPSLAKQIGQEIKKIEFSSLQKITKFSLDQREKMVKEAFGYKKPIR